METPIRISRSKTFGASLLVAAAALALPSARAAEIVKASNTTALNATGSWVGGVLPGVNDIMVWNSTLTGANSTALGGSLSVLGLKVTNPAGAITVGATTGATLTIGASGIDMSQATQNLTLSSALVIGANQNWIVAGGRTLTGPAGNSVSSTGTGNINFSRSSVAGFNTGIANVLFNANGNGTGWTGYSGNVIIGSNVKVQTQGNAAAALGSGIVTLDGGAVHQTSGSWTFGNTFSITADSTIGQDSSNGVGRLMKLLGDLGSTNGSGLTFTNTVTGGTRTDNVGIILAGANASTYGATTISANTRLRVGGNSEATIAGTGVGAAARGSLGTGAVSLAASTAELAFTRTDAHTVANAISGAGTVVIGGNTADLAATASQVVTLSGTSTYTGATRVSRSRLNLTGSLTSAITVDNSGSISGSGSTTGLLTLSSGAGIALAGGATTTSLTVNGATFSGSNLVTFLSAATANTVYDVFTYGNGAVTSINNLTVAWRGTLADDTANKKYIFTAGSSGTRTWNTTTGTWEQNGAANFAEGDQKFYGGDAVVFGAIASDSAITLAGAIAPASVTVSNAANTYTFSGTSIAGAASLAKSGNGSLVLSTAHTYSGGTSLSGGTLRIGNAASLGTGAVTVSGGTLDIAGFTPTNALTLGGSGNGSNPALWNSAGTSTTLGAVTLGADASVGNGSTDKNATLNLGVTNLAGNTLTIASGAVSINIRNFSSGNIVVADGGVLYTDNGTNTYASVTGTITLAAGGRMETRDTDNTAQTSSHTIALNGGTLSTGVIANNNGGGLGTTLRKAITVDAANGGSIVGNATGFSQNLRLTGAISGSGALAIGGAVGVELRGDATNYTGIATVSNGTLTLNTGNLQGFGGVIAGDRPLVKSGAGTTTLLADNTMSGTVTVNAGTLALSGAGAIGSASSVSLAVSGAALDVSAAASARTVNNLSAVSGTTVNLGSGALTLASSSATTITGVISGAGSLGKTGAATLTLAGANTFSGGFTLDGGIVSAQNNAAFGSGAITALSGTLGRNAARTIANNIAVDGALSLGGAGQNAGNLTLSGVISGAGTLTNVSGITLLTGANTFSGRLEIQGTAGEGFDVVLANLGAVGGAPDVHMTGGRLILATQFVGNVAAIGNLTGTAGIVNTQYGATTGVRTLKVTQDTDGAFAGVLTDGGGSRNFGLIKDGAATLELSGANPFSGGVDIRGGTLRLGLANSVGTSVVTLTGGALDINGLTFGNAITAAGGSLAGSGTLSGLISGSASLGIAATGTLTLSSANTFSGGMELTSGTVVAGNASAFGSGDILLSAGILDFNNLDVLNRVIFAGGTLINVRSGGAVAVGGSLTAEQINALDIPAIAATAGTTLDLAGVTKEVLVTGSATLNGLSSFGGTLAVSGGTLDLSDASNRPATIELRAGGTLDFGANEFTGNVTYKGGAVTGAFAGNLNVSGAVTLAAGNIPSGKVVVTTGNSVGLASGFAGTVRLEGGSVTSGIETFAGDLELGAGGSLDLTTDLASSADVVVDNGGALRGTGTVASLTVASGGLLAPGNSPGLTTVTGNLTLLGGGALDLEILATGGEIFDPVAGSDYDSVVVGGNLDLTGLSLESRFLINVISLLDPTTPGQVGDFDPALTKVYDVYAYTGELLKTYGGSATDLFQLDTTAFTFEGAALDARVFTLVHNVAEQKIQLVYAPIPEPSTYGLILGGLALAGAAIRRRRAKRA